MILQEQDTKFCVSWSKILVGLTQKNVLSRKLERLCVENSFGKLLL
jgi:hypothetical protein